MIELLPIVNLQMNKTATPSTEEETAFKKMLLQSEQTTLTKEDGCELSRQRDFELSSNSRPLGNASLDHLTLFSNQNLDGKKRELITNGGLFESDISLVKTDQSRAKVIVQLKGEIISSSMAQQCTLSQSYEDDLIDALDKNRTSKHTTKLQSDTEALIQQSYDWSLTANLALSQWQWNSIRITSHGVLEGAVIGTQREVDTTAVGVAGKGEQHIEFSARPFTRIKTSSGMNGAMQKHGHSQKYQLKNNFQANLKWSLPVEQSALFIIDKGEGEALLSIRNFFLSEDREKQLRDNLVRSLEGRIKSGFNRIRINGVEVWRLTR